MFHTYITASTGRKIDIDRASFLMDKELFADAHRALIKWICPNGFNEFDVAMGERFGGTKEKNAQQVWDAYCYSHKAKYSEPFAPDVDQNWDN